MRFIVDAQLPRRLAREINALGHEAVHTLDLPSGNRTADPVIVATADSERRVVVTKDRDFVDSFILRGEPAKLLLIATGNISNNELLRLLQMNWMLIVKMLEQATSLKSAGRRLSCTDKRRLHPPEAVRRLDAHKPEYPSQAIQHPRRPW